MVLFFTPQGSSASDAGEYVIYMGADKYENESLIKYGLPGDVWFHVDNLSSAHVYLRMPKGACMDSIPSSILEECCQLVKQNSIKGCKEPSVHVVYTPWGNLKKTGEMAVGQVGFHDERLVLRARVEGRNRPLLKRLNQSKQERFPDLQQLRTEYDREAACERRSCRKEEVNREREAREVKMREAEARSYMLLQQPDAMESNRAVAARYQTAEELEDDFM